MVEDPKKKNITIKVMCTPFTVYTGKINLKGAVSPIRFEFDEDIPV